MVILAFLKLLEVHGPLSSYHVPMALAYMISRVSTADGVTFHDYSCMRIPSHTVSIR